MLLFAPVHPSRRYFWKGKELRLRYLIILHMPKCLYYQDSHCYINFHPECTYHEYRQAMSGDKSSYYETQAPPNSPQSQEDEVVYMPDPEAEEERQNLLAEAAVHKAEVDQEIRERLKAVHKAEVDQEIRERLKYSQAIRKLRQEKIDLTCNETMPPPNRKRKGSAPESEEKQEKKKKLRINASMYV